MNQRSDASSRIQLARAHDVERINMSVDNKPSGRQIVNILSTCPILAGAFANLKPFLLALV